MPPAPEIKGWCPSAHRPMASNDGLLIRAKIVGSRVSAAQLDAIASISTDCGNGLVDLSQRAQVQIRGVQDATLSDALQRLGEAGLLARDADAERVTNIIVSPLAGLDTKAGFDANALANDLASALQADAALRALPAKFLFAVDDHGALPLSDVEADIRMDPTGDGRVSISIAGAENLAATVSLSQAVTSALALARAFVLLREGAFDLRRMRRLISVVGADRLFHEAGLAGQPIEQRPHRASLVFLGAREAHNISYVGVAAPLGRWRAQDLARLSALSMQFGNAELRMTPWRAFLIPTGTQKNAESIASSCEALGLIVSQDDPRLSVVACPGAPECPQAQGETRAHLARLAPLAQKLAGRDGVGLHVSGCAKGCARPGSSAVTLVANGNLFDLVEGGRASDAPQMSGLAIDAVERALAARAQEQTCPTP